MNAYQQAAKRNHDWGANVTCCNDEKRPLHKWKDIQTERQSWEEVTLYPWGNASANGIVNGINSWHHYDLDNCPDDAPVAALLKTLELPDDYAWVFRSGSGKGWGIIIRCDDRMPDCVLTMKADEPGVYWGWPNEGFAFDHLELRWERCQSILPPSKHATGPGYKWRGNEPADPPAVVSIGHVLAAFFAIAEAKKTKEPPKAEPHPRAGNPQDEREAIRRQFDLLAYALKHFPGTTQEEGDEIRILGHGGLLLNLDEGLWHIFADPNGGDLFDLVGFVHYGDRWDRHDKAMFRAALQEAADFAGVPLQERRNGSGPAHPQDTATARQLPQIVVNGRHLRDVTGDGTAALQAANTPPSVFIRGGRLARVVEDENGVTVAEHLTEGAARGLLERVANFVTEQHDKETKTYHYTPAHPPLAIVKDLLALGRWPGFPALAGIVTAPTVAANGTMHTQPGYNADSRLFYHPTDLVIGDTTPTPEAVARARRLICDDLLGEFPFNDDASKANAVALLLLPFIRPYISGPTPLHAVDAASPGSGKTLLSDVLTIPFAPLGGAVMTAGRNDDEWRKRITARLLTGPSHVTIDNVMTKLASGDLSAAITAPVWSDRILGRSEIANVPVRCVWIATGNNLDLSDELARRSCWIRLDPTEERPWTRTGFKHSDLRAWAKEHRGDIVTAALILIRNWLDHGTPRGTASLGGFEEWACVIGGILAAAGIDGFMGNATELYDRLDAERQAWVAFVAAWWDKYHDTEVGAKELWTLAGTTETKQADGTTLTTGADLLADLLGGGSERSRKTKLGQLLRNKNGRIYGAYKIVMGTIRHSAAQYKLVAVAPKGEPGEPITAGVGTTENHSDAEFSSGSGMGKGSQGSHV